MFYKSILAVFFSVAIIQGLIAEEKENKLLYLNSFENCSDSNLPDNVWFDIRPMLGNLNIRKENLTATEQYAFDGEKIYANESS